MKSAKMIIWWPSLSMLMYTISTEKYWQRCKIKIESDHLSFRLIEVWILFYFIQLFYLFHTVFLIYLTNICFTHLCMFFPLLSHLAEMQKMCKYKDRRNVYIHVYMWYMIAYFKISVSIFHYYLSDSGFLLGLLWNELRKLCYKVNKEEKL